MSTTLNMTDIEKIKAAREVTVHCTLTHVYPITVSDMSVLKELTGYGTWPMHLYDEMLAAVSAKGYCVAVQDRTSSGWPVRRER